MSKITYPGSSFYSGTPQTSWYLGRAVWKPIPPDSGDEPFTLTTKYQYRPDQLSSDLYGTPAYYWVFAIRNPFLRADPLWKFTAGTTIIVPTAAHVRTVAGT